MHPGNASNGLQADLQGKERGMFLPVFTSKAYDMQYVP